MIVFTKIKFKNFLSYGNSFTEIELNSHKSTLFVGKNGHGKSTVIECLTFALYGKAFRKINKNGLINSINSSALVVELEFKIGNEEYKIIRGIKPNIFEIYNNSILIAQDAKIKDYQEYLERYILKMNYKSFTQVVILGSARYTPFMQLTPNDRRAVIENLLDIQIFSNMNVLIKERISTVKEQIQQLKYDIDINKEKINIQNINLHESKKNSVDLITKKKEQITINLEEIKSIQSNIDVLLEENTLLESSIAHKQSVETKKEKLNTIYFKFENSIQKIEKDNNFYTKNDSCPICKQDIDHSFKHSIITKNNEKRQELNSAIVKLNSELDNIKDSLHKIIEINKKINANNNKLSEYNIEVQSLQRFINSLNSEILEIENKFLSKDSVDSKLQELKSIESNLVEEYEKVFLEKKYFDFVSVLLKDGGIKTQIIKQYLPILNKYINNYLSILEFFVNFNITEEFEEIIKSRHRDQFTYSNFSEGEKTRLDLAILFSFRQLAKLKNSVSTNLLILDEIFESSLDQNGIQCISNFLSTLDDSTNVFVISHKTDDLQDKFERVIKFEKVKNFTKIKQVL